MACVAEHGFPPGEFRRLGIGPVMQKDELESFREIGLYDTVTVTYAVLALSGEAARFVVENEIWSAARKLACRVRSTGGWLDLRTRKLVPPPKDLRAAFKEVPARRASSSLTGVSPDLLSAFYSLASEAYGRLKAAGTLEAVREQNSAETALALARCRGDSNH
jgi:acyl-CoA thioesterase FadM